MGTLFDVLYWMAWIIVYGAASAAGLAAGGALWGPHLVEQAGAVLVGYLVFLHAFVLVAGGLRILLQPRLTEGTTPIGLNRAYVAWGIQSVFQGLYTTSILARQIQILFYLRWLYYRLMGMRLSWSTLIGTQAVIRNAELIWLGPRVIIGEDAMLVPHLSPDGKTHLMRRIKVGARSVIGGRAGLGPGVEVGEGSVVGGMAALSIDVKVGDGVRIGPGALIMPGVTIGDGAKVLAGSVVKEKTVIAAGEVWGGNPAQRIGP